MTEKFFQTQKCDFGKFFVQTVLKNGRIIENFEIKGALREEFFRRQKRCV